MPTRALAFRCGCLTSMFIACSFKSAVRRSSGRLGPSAQPRHFEQSAVVEPIIGRKGILHQDFATQRSWYSRRHGLVAVELPMREVGSVEQYGVGTQMLDQALHAVGIGRSIERLGGEADMVANDLRRGAVAQGHFCGRAAPES